MLTVLLHVTASALSFVIRDMSEADAGKYVASYLLQITKILDAAANPEASNANR